MKQMEKAQMLNVVDAYIHMLKDVYGEACPKRAYACKDVICQMAHRLLKEIRETAEILRCGSPEEQRMMALMLTRNEIIELLMEDLQAYRMKSKSIPDQMEGINPLSMTETTSIKGA